MRKVLMITSDAPIDRRIILEAETLSENSFNVSILNPNGLHDCHGLPIQTANLSKNLEIGFYWNLALNIYRSTKHHLPSPMAEMFSFVARKLFSLFTLQTSDINANFYKKMFVQTAEHFPANIIVAHDLPVLKASSIIAHKKKARLVYDSHELYCEQELTQKAKDEWRRLEKSLIVKCNLVMTVNNSISNELSTRYDIRKPLVITNADRQMVPSKSKNNDYLRTKFNLSRTDKIILLQGGLLRNRNLETFVESARYFPDGVFGIFLGDGPHRAALMTLSKNLGVSHKIRFHDVVNQALLLNITASATVGLIPYQPTCLNNYYCTPNKMFEYISAGVPIIATDLPEISKVINTFQIGLVGDTSSATALSELILKIIQCPKDLDSMKMNMRVAQKTLSWENQAVDLVNAFRKLA